MRAALLGPPPRPARERELRADVADADGGDDVRCFAAMPGGGIGAVTGDGAGCASATRAQQLRTKNATTSATACASRPLAAIAAVWSRSSSRISSSTSAGLAADMKSR